MQVQCEVERSFALLRRFLLALAFMNPRKWGGLGPLGLLHRGKTFSNKCKIFSVLNWKPRHGNVWGIGGTFFSLFSSKLDMILTWAVSFMSQAVPRDAFWFRVYLSPCAGLKAVGGGKKKRQSLPEAEPLLPWNPSCGLVIVQTELPLLHRFGNFLNFMILTCLINKGESKTFCISFILVWHLVVYQRYE